MKDNFPNYLNPHNIDPGRIDVPPGNDSIRPLRAPTMSNDEAIRILADIETDIYGRVAIWKAIEALKKIPDPET